MTKPSRQFVLSFHFARRSLLNLSSAVFWFCAVSSCLIAGVASFSVCCLAGVIFWTWKT